MIQYLCIINFIVLTQQICNTPGFITCSILTALSIDNTDGNIGSYFNFNGIELNTILGRNDWNAENFNIYHNRHSKFINMSFFNTNQGGTSGDSYGQIQNDDIFSDINANNFQIGDKIVIGQRCSFLSCQTCIQLNECLDCIGTQNVAYSRTVDPNTSINDCRCPNGYYSNLPFLDDCIQCSFEECKECENGTECSVCKGILNEEQSRIINPNTSLNECICPEGYTSDLNIQEDCIPNSCAYETCLECINITQCSICIGVQNQEKSRGANSENINDCSCPSNYYSIYPTQDDCVKCPLLSCSTCTQNQCLSCIGVQNEPRSRVFDPDQGIYDCRCPKGYYSNLPYSDDCVKCLEGCQECENQILCLGGQTGCIGVHGEVNSRGINPYNNRNECICPEGYYSDIDQGPDCLKCSDNFDGCAACSNQTSCTKCIGVQNQPNSRGVNPLNDKNECICPRNYYSVYPNSDDCEQCTFLACYACIDLNECTVCVGTLNQPHSRTYDPVTEINDCRCPLGYYSDLPLNDDCIACNYEGCKECTNALECSVCKGVQNQEQSRGLSTETNRNECVCPEGYTSDLSIQEDCIPDACAYETCIECVNITSCTKCIGSQNQPYSRGINPITNINDCSCPYNYFSIYPTQDDCVQCSFLACLTCSQYNQCTACVGTQGQPYSRILDPGSGTYDCRCPLGYASDLPNSNDCRKCLEGCLYCENLTECSGGVTGCIGVHGQINSRGINPLNNKNECICPDGYYSDITVGPDCLKCSNNFEGCLTCSNNNSCTSCIGTQGQIFSRTYNPFTNKLECVCPKNYYSVLPEPDCVQCGKLSCYTCINQFECTVCVGAQNQPHSRILSDCRCPVGYYSNLPYSDDCIKCLDGCISCVNNSECLGGITDCIGDHNQVYSRGLNSSGVNQCICPDGYYSDINVGPNCLRCQDNFDGCLTCNNNFSCTSCIGIQNQINTRGINPATNQNECKCPRNHFSIYPQQDDCVQCTYLSCYACTQLYSCTVCVGTSNQPYSRIPDPDTGVNDCRCPIGYYSDLPQNDDCQKCFDGCIDCNDNIECLGGLTGCIGVHGQIHSRGINPLTGKNECICPEGYYSDISIGPDCLKCQDNFDGCKSCENNTQCTSCIGTLDQVYSRSINPINNLLECVCPYNYYSELPAPDCKKCKFEGCKHCENQIECTVCFGTSDNTLLEGRVASPISGLMECICRTGYYSNLPTEENCLKCLEGCIDCNDGTQCIGGLTGCIGIHNAINSRGYNYNNFKNECICPDGYYSDIIIGPDCLKCTDNFEGCRTCKDSTECLTCVGVQGESNSRIIAPNGKNECICPERHYSDIANGNQDCVSCPFESCLTCINRTECLICRGIKYQQQSRIPNAELGINDCQCPIGYYSDFQAQENCIKCEFQCVSCQENTYQCIECVDGRLMENLCKCPPGFYDDGVDLTCLVCQRGDGCIECDKDKCLKCHLNQIVNTNPDINEECNCIAPKLLSHVGITEYCTDCETMVIKKISFNDDYSKINIDFYDEIIIRVNLLDVYSYSNDFCLKLLQPETLQILGIDPKCSLNMEGTQISIKLGYKSTILQNDFIYLRGQIIQRVVCQEDEYINTFKEFQMTLDAFTGIPYAQYNKLSDTISLCQDIQASINNIKNDGNRGLFNFIWSLESTNQPNAQKIQKLIQNMNTKKLNYLLIPALTLEAGFDYQIKVTYENFASQQNHNLFTFSILEEKIGIVAKTVQTRPFLFKTYQYNEINAIISLVDCSDIYFTNIPASLNVTWIDESNINDPITIIETLTQPGEQLQKYTMEKYSQIPGQVYSFRIKVQLPFQQKFQNLFFLYEIEKSKLIAKIEGGNRLQAYTNEIIVNSRGFNPDLSNNQEEGIKQDWECQELGDSIPCQTILGDLLIFNNTNQVYIGKQLMEPYNSLLFIYSIAKLNMESQQDRVMIVVVETDLPQLSVSVPDSFKNQKINLNDDLQIQMLSDKNPDNVFYSLIFLYKLEVVMTKAFDYNRIGFKIWDLYNGFNTNSDTLQIRVSMYDPQYFMPSTSNFNIVINFEPQEGTIIIEPLIGYAMETQFFISLEGFEDEDLPLSYKFQYYLSEQEYLTEISNGTKNIKYKKNILNEYQNLNYYSTKLPLGNYNQNDGEYYILVMVSVSDSLGAIRNITQIVETQPSLLNFEDLLNQYQQELDSLEFQLIDDQINYLNLLAIQLNNLGVPNCQNNCKGNGECIEVQQTFECKCNKTYYLNDCSQNTGQEKYISILQQTYQKLQEYTQQAKSLAIKDQILKSINVLLNNDEMGKSIQSTDLDNNFQSQNLLLKQQEEIMESLMNSGQLYQGDNIASIQFQQTTEVLSKSLENLDSTFKSIEIQKTNKISDNNSNIEIYSEQMVELSKNVTKILQVAQIPNSEPLEYLGSQLKIQTQKLTNKKMEDLFFQSESTIIESFYSLNDNKDNNQIENSQIYDTNQFIYKQNPFKQDEGFPVRDQDVGVNDLDIKNTDLDSNEDIQITKPINIRFPSQENTKNQQCITRNNSKKQWSTSNCKTQEIESEKGEAQINCECTTLEPATVVDNFENLLENSLIDDVFSDDGLKKLETFQFWEFYMFYIILLKTLFFIATIIYGYQLDHKVSNKIQNQDKELDSSDSDYEEQNKISKLKPLKIKKLQLQFDSDDSKISSPSEDEIDKEKKEQQDIENQLKAIQLFNIQKQNKDKKVKRIRQYNQLYLNDTSPIQFTQNQSKLNSNNNNNNLQTDGLYNFPTNLNFPKSPQNCDTLNSPIFTPKLNNTNTAYSKFKNNFKIQTQFDLQDKLDEEKSTPLSNNYQFSENNLKNRNRFLSGNTDCQDQNEQQLNSPIFSIQTQENQDQDIQQLKQSSNNEPTINIQGLEQLYKTSTLIPILQKHQANLDKKKQQEKSNKKYNKELKQKRKAQYQKQFGQLTKEEIIQIKKQQQEEEKIQKLKNEELEKQEKEEQLRKKAQVFHQPIQEEQITPISAGVIEFHEFFNIFYSKDEKINRPLRLTFYYLKITTLIAISALFSQNTTLIESIILSIISAIFITVPMLILITMYKSKIIFKILSIMLLIIFQLLVIYAILVTAAIMGKEQSNIWIKSYVYTFMTDFCAIIPIKTTITLSIIKFAIQKGKKYLFIDEKSQEKMIRFLYPYY